MLVHQPWTTQSGTKSSSCIETIDPIGTIPNMTTSSYRSRAGSSDIPGDYDGMMGVPITFLDNVQPGAVRDYRCQIMIVKTGVLSGLREAEMHGKIDRA